jgi:hypothetical protein
MVLVIAISPRSNNSEPSHSHLRHLASSRFEKVTSARVSHAVSTPQVASTPSTVIVEVSSFGLRRFQRRQRSIPAVIRAARGAYNSSRLGSLPNSGLPSEQPGICSQRTVISALATENAAANPQPSQKVLPRRGRACTTSSSLEMSWGEEVGSICGGRTIISSPPGWSGPAGRLGLTWALAEALRNKLDRPITRIVTPRVALISYTTLQPPGENFGLDPRRIATKTMQRATECARSGPRVACVRLSSRLVLILWPAGHWARNRPSLVWESAAPTASGR